MKKDKAKQRHYNVMGQNHFLPDGDPEGWFRKKTFSFDYLHYYGDYLEGWNEAKDIHEAIKETKEQVDGPFDQLRERINDHINTGGDNEILHILRDMLDLIEDNKD